MLINFACFSSQSTYHTSSQLAMFIFNKEMFILGEIISLCLEESSSKNFPSPNSVGGTRDIS